MKLLLLLSTNILLYKAAFHCPSDQRLQNCLDFDSGKQASICTTQLICPLSFPLQCPQNTVLSLIVNKQLQTAKCLDNNDKSDSIPIILGEPRCELGYSLILSLNELNQKFYRCRKNASIHSDVSLSIFDPKIEQCPIGYRLNQFSLKEKQVYLCELNAICNNKDKECFGGEGYIEGSLRKDNKKEEFDNSSNNIKGKESKDPSSNNNHSVNKTSGNSLTNSSDITLTEVGAFKVVDNTILDKNGKDDGPGNSLDKGEKDRASNDTSKTDSKKGTVTNSTATIAINNTTVVTPTNLNNTKLDKTKEDESKLSLITGTFGKGNEVSNEIKTGNNTSSIITKDKTLNSIDSGKDIRLLKEEDVNNLIEMGNRELKLILEKGCDVGYRLRVFSNLKGINYFYCQLNEYNNKGNGFYDFDIELDKCPMGHKPSKCEGNFFNDFKSYYLCLKEDKCPIYKYNIVSKNGLKCYDYQLLIQFNDAFNVSRYYCLDKDLLFLIYKNSEVKLLDSSITLKCPESYTLKSINNPDKSNYFFCQKENRLEVAEKKSIFDLNLKLETCPLKFNLLLCSFYARPFNYCSLSFTCPDVNYSRNLVPSKLISIVSSTTINNIYT
ncbi:hypothetical protein K502DRAFT_329137 [Neoconidiobolus thromboides FSU 785]|nr:hypothetical protein K502DRAFT_329137 [Neoconidiobolus thromboides FSU 785]